MPTTVNNQNPLSIYDYAARAARGAITAYASSKLTTMCLNTLLTISNAKWDSVSARTAGNFTFMASSALITGWLAYKSAMRVVKEARGIFLEMEMIPLLNDPSKNEGILFLQANADWSGDATCLTRSSFKLLKTLSSQYSLFRERVGSVEDINAAIDKFNQTGNSLKAVIIVGHGTHSKINLSRMLFFNNLTASSAETLNFEALRDSKIILMSCYGGVLANDIQAIAGPSIKLEGSSTICGPRCVGIKDIDTLSFSFFSPITNKETTIRTSFEDPPSCCRSIFTNAAAKVHSILLSITPILVAMLCDNAARRGLQDEF